jgi:hypothetical protein
VKGSDLHSGSYIIVITADTINYIIFVVEHASAIDRVPIMIRAFG